MFALISVHAHGRLSKNKKLKRLSGKSNIRIIDIARMAKVSAGTVDRVIHNRPGVSAKNKEKVEKVMKQMNYEPNMVARFLASRKTYIFAIVIPSYKKGEYWELVSEGIKKASDELKDFNVSVEYLYFNQYDNESLDSVIKDIDNANYQGVVVATLYKKHVVELSKKLSKNNIPYIYIDSNIEGQENLSYFGADSVQCGAMAAKLMLLEIGSKAEIVIANTQFDTEQPLTQIENRQVGFLNYLKKNKFEGKLSYFDLNSDNKQKAVGTLDKLLANKEGGVGAIIFNSRVHELVSVVDKTTNKSKIKSIIGYDTLHQNIQDVKSGKISFLISQRSIQQGYESVKALSNYLIFNGELAKENFMAIDILVQENVDFYYD